MDMTQQPMLIAQAIATLPHMPSRALKQLRAQLEQVAAGWRDELVQPISGERRLEWWDGPGHGSRLIARGHAGQAPRFELRDEHDKVLATWDGPLAARLNTFGHDGTLKALSVEQRDELEAVLEEEEAVRVLASRQHARLAVLAR